MTRNQKKINSNSYNSNCDGKDIYFYQNRLVICFRFHIIFYLLLCQTASFLPLQLILFILYSYCESNTSIYLPTLLFSCIYLKFENTDIFLYFPAQQKKPQKQEVSGESYAWTQVPFGTSTFTISERVYHSVQTVVWGLF